MFMLTIPLLLSSSLLFTQLSHPLAMGLMLFIQTVLISITVGMYNFSFWFSYILFLVFLGGMLILFIYIASLASNESFIFSFTTSLFFIVTAFFFLFGLLFMDPLIAFPSSFTSSSSLNFYFSTPFIINWIYNTPSMIFTIFIVSYLLLMLIIIVKITNLFKGPLRLIS
uniref:NADH dehydrogenase subunit 6 n=1 Tax=Hemigrapsus sinensis TaxID=486111 RepID=UPI00218201A2|nr:NADH dehydrogenase subunit 6 [Hemigrapsus sinensis]UVF28721.1 NADH dehydrogenase subunit 6 [Hemigrapsus sinensis]